MIFRNIFSKKQPPPTPKLIDIPLLEGFKPPDYDKWKLTPENYFFLQQLKTLYFLEVNSKAQEVAKGTLDKSVLIAITAKLELLESLLELNNE